MRFRNTVPGIPARAVIALAVALLLLATGGLWDRFRDGAAPVHGPHALSSEWAAELGATADHEHPIITHPHAQHASNHVAPDSFATAVMRRAATAPVTLGLLVVALGLAPLWFQRLQVAARGPPRAAALVVSNRAILTRFCVARR